MASPIRFIKRLIPNSLKYPFWWLFKSPQRKLGWFTLSTDLRGLFLFLRAHMISPALHPVSICTGIYNRSPLYLAHFLESINRAKHAELIELSVFDCGSTDIADLEAAISQQWKGKLVFAGEPVKFSRAYSFNHAVKQATNEIVFLCDADMSVPQDIVELCNRYTGRRSVWYPIVFYLLRGKQPAHSTKSGHWMQYGGKGMLACTKKSFIEVGMLDESFTEWGREDDELWERFMKQGYSVIRNRQNGLFHHWHPSFNPKYRDMAEN
jgi:glycosyltransferase involved in cell wall biosynthesis